MNMMTGPLSGKMNRVVDLSNGGDFPDEATEYLPYLENAEQAARQFNKRLAKLNLPIRVATNTIRMNYEQNDIDDSNWIISNFCARKRQGKNTDGQMWKAQIYTVCDLIERLYNKPCVSSVVWGPFQAGKTGVANGIHLAALFMYLLTGTKFYPMAFLPGNNGQVSQAKEEYLLWRALYGKLDIQKLDETGVIIEETNFSDYVEKSTTLQKYQHKILKIASEQLSPIANACQQRIARKDSETNNSLMDYATALTIHARTNDAPRIAMVKEVCGIAEKEGYALIGIIDECHWGADRQGVMARFLNNVIESMADQNCPHVMVGLSATPYQYGDLDGIQIVRQHLSEGYCGPNFINKELIDASITTVLPRIRSIREQLKVLGVTDENRTLGLNFTLYNTAKSFKAWKKQIQKTFHNYNYSHLEYKYNFEEQMATIIQDDLGVGKTLDRPLAMCLRVTNSNNISEEFIRTLNLDDSIHVLYYNADHSNGLSTKAFIKLHGATSERLLLVVTGAARMADAFPTMFNDTDVPLRWTYLELTKKASSQASLLQGLYGRSCGYGKIIDGIPPLVISSEENTEMLNAYHTSMGCIIHNKAISKTVIDKPMGRQGKPVIQLPVLVKMPQHEADPVLQKLFSDLQKHVDEYGPQKNNLQGRKGDAGNIWSIITDDIMTYIEDNSSRLYPEIIDTVSLIRVKPLSEVVKGEHFYLVDGEDSTKGNYGMIRVNSQDKKSGGGADMTLRDARRDLPETRTLTDAIEMAIQPQVYVFYDKTKGWVFRGILLRLTAPVREREPDAQVRVVLPTEDSIADNFLSLTQREAPALRKYAERKELRAIRKAKVAA